MNEFQQVIKAYLDQRVQEDTQFASNYAKKGKSITTTQRLYWPHGNHKGNIFFISIR